LSNGFDVSIGFESAKRGVKFKSIAH